MKRRTFYASSAVRQKGFSAASDVCGLRRPRSYAVSVGPPAGRSVVRGYGSGSACHLGIGSRLAEAAGCAHGCYGGHGIGGPGWVRARCGSAGGLSGSIGPGGWESFGGYAKCRGDAFQGVCIDTSLLKPLCVGVDPQEHRAREQEREQMKTLNNQFACFIDKVCQLEQQNKALETKWNLLQQCVPPAPRKDLEPCFKNYIFSLRQQLEALVRDKDHLVGEESSSKQQVDDLQCKYEEEIRRRTEAEAEFMVLKKEADCVLLHNGELEANVSLLQRKLAFLRGVFEEERAQVDRRLRDAAVVVKMDNRRDLDTDCIIQNVDGWYKEIALKSREEVDALHRARFQELQGQRDQFREALQRNKCEVSELTRVTQVLQGETDHAKKQLACLQAAIEDAEQRGHCALADARGKHTELQGALRNAEAELAGMLRDYRELLNVKLGLDIEITTYKTLLEGEESRICVGNPVSISVVPGSSNLAGDGGAAPGSGSGYGSGYSGDLLGQGFSSQSLGVGSRVAVSVAGCQSIPEGANGCPPGGFSSRSGSCISGSVATSLCSHHLPGGVPWGPPPGAVPDDSSYGSKVVTGSGSQWQVSGGAACCPDGGYSISSGYPGNGVYTFETGGFIIQCLGSSPAGGLSSGVVGSSGAGPGHVGVPGGCEVVKETYITRNIPIQTHPVQSSLQ